MRQLSAFADSSALILRGVAGSQEHEAQFEKWTAGTNKALVDKFGFSADRVILLTGAKTAQAEIQKAFATLKQQLKPLRYVVPFLYRSRQRRRRKYKFNISGPDYTADDYNKLLSGLTVGRIVIIAAHACQRRGVGEIQRKESRGRHRYAQRPGRKRHRLLRLLP